VSDRVALLRCDGSRQRTCRDLGRGPAELQLATALDGLPDAHQLQSNHGAVLVVLDRMPLRRLERLCWRFHRLSDVQEQHIATRIVVLVVEVDSGNSDRHGIVRGSLSCSTAVTTHAGS
jgi:hypothetical protein